MNANDPSPAEATNGAGPASADEQDTATSPQADLEARHAELCDAYLRAKAEAENTRRRAEEELGKARKFAVESFAESLLPVKDSLEAAIAIPAATPEQLLEGVHATLRQLAAALERNKVVEVNPPAGTSAFDRTSTRRSAWCRPRRSPTRSSPCCRRAISSPTACCGPLSSR
jgi:molecular chaperone GrpE